MFEIIIGCITLIGFIIKIIMVIILSKIAIRLIRTSPRRRYHNDIH
jgi:hypothetical protein